MRARIKYYLNIFDACEDKNGFSVVMYGDDRKSIMNSVYGLTEKYVVSNVYIDDPDKAKEQNG